MSQITAAWFGSRRSGSRMAVASVTTASIAVVQAPRGVRLAKIIAIGTAAGAFTGLFGAGGGTVIVPLLIFWLAYGEREATGTSLAALVLIALFAAVVQGIYGNVDLLKGLVIGVPAVVGVLAGTALHQRLPERSILALFALLLLVIAGQLMIE